jgi:agmatinase
VAASIINSDGYEAEVVLRAANNDISSSFGKGADKGPEAIRACLDRQIEFREPRTGIVATERLKITWHDLGDLNGTRTRECLGGAIHTVAVNCAASIEAGRKVFIVGGDHSNSIGALIGVGQRYDPDKVTILHIDAHHDLRHDDADYNDKPYGNLAHCCAMRPAVTAGFHLVSVGVRAFSLEEDVFVQQNRKRVKAFRWGMERSFMPPPVSIIANAIETDLVYISVDVDGFDPAFMPATGTPVSGGLGWWYGWDLLQEVCRRKTVVGADLCEVAPRPNDTLTEYNAAQLIYCVITWAWAAKKR